MTVRSLFLHCVVCAVALGEAHAVVAAVPSSSSRPSLEDEVAQIHVLVEGIGDDVGVIRFALYDKAQEFTDGVQYRSLAVDIPSVKRDGVYFKELPAGYYAIAIYHDRNDNNIFDMNFLGIPLEDYGFSRDAKPFFSSPPFKDAAFPLKAGQNLRLVIQVQSF